MVVDGAVRAISAICYKSSTSDAQVAQSVEHVLGKDEVSGSIPLLGFLPGDKERQRLQHLQGIWDIKILSGKEIGGRDE
jgi:hypothetical protein